MEIEIGQLIKNNSTNAFTHKAVSQVHEFYLSGTIGNPEEYVDWFDLIRNSNENDLIKIYINSEGGNLFTAIQFMRVLSTTEAKVWVSVEGACMSAATMIMLCADSFEISLHSMFMVHNYSGGTVGKGGEMYDNIVFERKWSEDLLRQIYEGFLTEQEIDMVLDNKDIWMDGEDVINRLKKRVEKLEDEATSIPEESSE